MIDQTATFLVSIAIQSSLAVLFATIGAVLTERSGVLNLGVEGMMIIGVMMGVLMFICFAFGLGIARSITGPIATRRRRRTGRPRTANMRRSWRLRPVTSVTR